MPEQSLNPLTFPLLIDLGILAGLGFSLWRARRHGERINLILDAALLSLLGGLLGGKVVAIGLYADLGGQAGIASLVFDSGWAWPGALTGGISALALYSWAKVASFWKLADVLAPGLTLGQAIGWLGCLNTGCASGVPATGPLVWWLPDGNGIYAYRLPTPIFFAALFLLIFLFLFARRPTNHGLTFTFYLLLSSTGLFFLEFLRNDATLYLGVFRYSQILELMAAIFALALLHLRNSRRNLSRAPT